MNDISIGLKIGRGKPSLVKVSQAMTVLIVYDIHHCICYYAKLWNGSSKSRAHIAVANRICKPF